jgi:protoporphyrin/coproporphyrin ferrochelatase
MRSTALLLINVGTPDRPEVTAVRRYLSEFLNDPMVMDIPWLIRKTLVNLIIVPFRAPKSTKLYQRLWTNNGSPLLYYANSVKEKLQSEVKASADVFVAMRYGNPSIDSGIKQIRDAGYEKLILLPLFPQYASSTTETAIQAVHKSLKKLSYDPKMAVIKQFYNHPAFLKAFADRISALNPLNFDYIIFSYHGLPVRHINKAHPDIAENQCNCTFAMPDHGKFCYKATCYETTRLLAGLLNLPEGKYSTSFQSRLTKNWLTPFTDQTIRELAGKEIKRILVVAPAFVADCLETTIEIGEEYRELFKHCGGKELVLVESLNDSDMWISAIREIASI